MHSLLSQHGLEVANLLAQFRGHVVCLDRGPVESSIKLVISHSSTGQLVQLVHGLTLDVEAEHAILVGQPDDGLVELVWIIGRRGNDESI